MVVKTKSETGNKIWKKFLRKQWKMVVLFIVGAILASIGATLVCLWVVGEVQLAGLVPATLGLWSMGHLVTFLLRLVFWEVLIIGVPVILAAVAIIFLWWKKIPDREMREYKRGHLFGTRSRPTNGKDVLSPLVFIVFCIKVFLDGNWNVAFGTWTFDYVVYSFLWALIWVLIIFGIPMVLGGTWWIRHEMKKKP